MGALPVISPIRQSFLDKVIFLKYLFLLMLRVWFYHLVFKLISVTPMYIFLFLVSSLMVGLYMTLLNKQLPSKKKKWKQNFWWRIEWLPRLWHHSKRVRIAVALLWFLLDKNFENGMNYLIFPTMGQLILRLFFYKNGSGCKWPTKVDMPSNEEAKTISRTSKDNLIINRMNRLFAFLLWLRIL